MFVLYLHNGKYWCWTSVNDLFPVGKESLQSCAARRRLGRQVTRHTKDHQTYYRQRCQKTIWCLHNGIVSGKESVDPTRIALFPLLYDYPRLDECAYRREKLVHRRRADDATGNWSTKMDKTLIQSESAPILETIAGALILAVGMGFGRFSFTGM